MKLFQFFIIIFLSLSLTFKQNAEGQCPDLDRETVVAISNSLIRQGVETESLYDLERARTLRICIGENKGKSFASLEKLIIIFSEKNSK